ncbi:MAG: hypothetical protein ACPGUV_00545 [Polyangiales bacterium]
MPRCAQCKEEVDDVMTVSLHGRRRKLCEECAEIAEQEAEIAEASEAAVQSMMGYKGRR